MPERVTAVMMTIAAFRSLKQWQQLHPSRSFGQPHRPLEHTPHVDTRSRHTLNEIDVRTPKCKPMATITSRAQLRPATSRTCTHHSSKLQMYRATDHEKDPISAPDSRLFAHQNKGSYLTHISECEGYLAALLWYLAAILGKSQK